MALNIKWSRILSFLKNPIKTYRQWRNRKKTLLDDKKTIANTDVVEKNIGLITQNIEDEISLTLLQNQIELIENRKKELSKKARNKYNNQLDQLLMRANARLRKLKELTFEELDLERILVEQKLLLAKKVRNDIIINPIDFARIRSHENLLSNVNLNAIKEQPRNVEIIMPKEAEDEVSVLLEELLIEVEPDCQFVDWGAFEAPISFEEKDRSKNRSEETDEIINYLKEQGISGFYHVTNFKNMQSIENIGLYSWASLDAMNVLYYNELTDGLSKNLDYSKGKQDYVRLSFCRATPMFYKFKHLQSNIIYHLDIECLRECDYLFSDRNGTDNNVKFGATLKFLKDNVRLDLTNKNYDWNWPELERKKYQAEILIKNYIPSAYIIKKIQF